MDLCVWLTIIIIIPQKVLKAKVNTKWLVVVKHCGTKPKILESNTNKKIV